MAVALSDGGGGDSVGLDHPKEETIASRYFADVGRFWFSRQHPVGEEGFERGRSKV